MFEKAKKFRRLLGMDGYFTLMEAHNGLSAKIVQETGFPAIWASGLSITASLGVRDNNEISYTQLIDVLEYMNDACDIPILVDGDTGYGNFNNARIFVRKLESRGIAAACIEDKKFPKTNSFLETSRDALAPIDEFVGKIKAIKDAQRTSEFALIARLEALILQAGMDEALKRAYAYREAGADALLVHSKKSDAREIYAFLDAFTEDIPIFLVPTKYYSEPVKKLTRDPRVRGLIWANHNIRTSLLQMRKTCAKIYAEGSIAGVEDSIATVSQVFEIQGNEEYMEAEKKYLPPPGKIRALIMAAGDTKGMDIDIPRAMIPINGQTLLERQVSAFHSCGVHDVIVVSGYKKEKIKPGDFTMIENKEWETTGVIHSIAIAMDGEDMPYMVTFGDVFFKRYILREMMDNVNEVVLVCVKENYIHNNYVLLTHAPITQFDENASLLLADVLHGNDHESTAHTVYFSGLMLVRKPGQVNKILRQSDTRAMSMENLFCKMLEKGMRVGLVLTTTDSVVDINSAQEILMAGELN